MMYGWSQYATGSGLPIGSWLLPMWGMMGQNTAQCSALQSAINSPVFYIGTLFYFITWVLILITLIALIRFLWKRAGHY